MKATSARPAGNEQGNKTQQAYDYLLGAIVSGEYAAGARLSERPLEAKLHISRTPIRAALEKLSFEGYLEADENNGLVVTRIGFPNYIEICELRDAIEQLSVRLAAVRHTPEDLENLEASIREHKKSLSNSLHSDLYDAEFHLLIAKASRNEQIVLHLEQLIAQARRATVYLNLTDRKRVEASIRQHEEIFSFLQKGDADGAVAAMSAHLQDVISTTKDHMAEYYFMYK